MGVVVTLKSKMATSSASGGGNSKNLGSRAISKVKQIARAATRRPSHIRTSQHYCHLNFSLRGVKWRHTGFIRDYSSHIAKHCLTCNPMLPSKNVVFQNTGLAPGWCSSKQTGNQDLLSRDSENLTILAVGIMLLRTHKKAVFLTYITNNNTSTWRLSD